MSDIYWISFSGSPSEWHLAIERGGALEFPDGEREAAMSVSEYRDRWPGDKIVGPVRGPDSRMPGGIEVIQSLLETLRPVPDPRAARSVCCHQVFSLLGAMLDRLRSLTARATSIELRQNTQETKFTVDYTTMHLRVQALERQAGISSEVQPSQPWPRGDGNNG